MRRALATLLWIGIAIPASADPSDTNPSQNPTASLAGRVDGERIRAADGEPQQWLAHGRTYDEQRYSPLTAIHPGNVSDLGLAWSYGTGTKRGLEATPIMVDGVLYATGSWSIVFALDAKTGRELWRFDPKVSKSRGRFACCDVVNRGPAVWKGRVYVGALDGRLIAIDAATGAPVWTRVTTDPDQPYTITSAPRVVKDKVIIGNSGAEFGVRGYFSAYDAATGELVWRFYTVPKSADGPHEHAELELAAKTWSRDSMWESGLGGTVWNSMAYDPELDLLYVGTGNSSVYNRSLRSPGGGDNLFLSSILAIKPDTGKMVWHYQTTPGEFWDFTAVEHMILADLDYGGGAKRKVLLQAPKNGFFYVLDRATGELISAENYVPVSWASGIDMETGRPIERTEAHWDTEPAFVMPGPPGGHNWHPMAFSPRTGLVYIPTFQSAYPYTPNPDFEFVKGAWNTGEDWGELAKLAEGFEMAMKFCAPTHITAWDPIAQRKIWRRSRESAVNSGLLVTASDLLFSGNGKNRFEAYDARTGQRVWASPVGVAIMAPPITYAIDGEQYVAVLAGVGGSAGIHSFDLTYENDGRMFVYKLGGTAALPAVRARKRAPIDPPEKAEANPVVVARGQKRYSEQCLQCHGVGTISNGIIPDLRRASRDVHETWNDIVLGGTRAHQGMASFADVLTKSDSTAIHAYVVSRALHEPSFNERLAEWFGGVACIPAGWIAD